MTPAPIALIFFVQGLGVISEIFGQRLTRLCHNGSQIRMLISMSVYCSVQATIVLGMAEFLLPYHITGNQGPFSVWHVILTHPLILLNSVNNGIAWLSISYLLQRPMGALLLVVAFLTASLTVPIFQQAFGLAMSKLISTSVISLGVIGGFLCAIELPIHWSNRLAKLPLRLLPISHSSRARIFSTLMPASALAFDTSDFPTQYSHASYQDSTTCLSALLRSLSTILAFVMVLLTTGVGLAFIDWSHSVLGLNEFGYTAVDQMFLFPSSFLIAYILDKSSICRKLFGEPPKDYSLLEALMHDDNEVVVDGDVEVTPTETSETVLTVHEPDSAHRSPQPPTQLSTSGLPRWLLCSAAALLTSNSNSASTSTSTASSDSSSAPISPFSCRFKSQLVLTLAELLLPPVAAQASTADHTQYNLHTNAQIDADSTITFASLTASASITVGGPGAGTWRRTEGKELLRRGRDRFDSEHRPNRNSDKVSSDSDIDNDYKNDNDNDSDNNASGSPDEHKSRREVQGKLRTGSVTGANVYGEDDCDKDEKTSFLDALDNRALTVPERRLGLLNWILPNTHTYWKEVLPKGIRLRLDLILPYARNVYSALIPMHTLEFIRTLFFFYLTTSYDLASVYLSMNIVRIILAWIASILVCSYFSAFIGLSTSERAANMHPVPLMLKLVGSILLVKAFLMMD